MLDDIQTRLFIDRQQPGERPDRHRRGGQRPAEEARRYVELAAVHAGARPSCARTTWTRACCRRAARRRCDGYRKLLHRQNYFDYTELLRMVVDLLGEDADDDMAGPLVRHVRDHVRYVVVDEYQDTNPVQEQLIERLCRFGANLCVVGDDDQTIYQWRGSAVSNILTSSSAAAGVSTVTLDDNFRSSQGDRRARPGGRRAERPASGWPRTWSPPATSSSTAATCSR